MWKLHLNCFEMICYYIMGLRKRNPARGTTSCHVRFGSCSHNLCPNWKWKQKPGMIDFFFFFLKKHVHLPTTFKYAIWLFIGSVFIWHIYHPLSDSLTSRIFNIQARFSACVTIIRWFFVITCVWIVRIVCVSTRNHAICNERRKNHLQISLQRGTKNKKKEESRWQVIVRS